MRKAAALPVVLVACFSCTYNIPDLRPGGGAGSGDDASALEASTADGSGGADGSTADGLGSGDASTASDAQGGPPDAHGGGDAPCTGVLCPCSGASDCTSGICAQSPTVGQSLYAASGSFCTSPCCTSADCPAGAVCFGSGQGGNYCVNPSWLGRSTTLGGGHGGASCTTDAQCRSGLCGGNACADTCCSFAGSATECAGGDACAFGAFPGRVTFDHHFGGRCGTPSSIGLGYGASCNDSSQCAGGLCVSGGCTNPCHDPSECGAGSACQLGIESGDIYVACFPWSATGAQGTGCSSDSVCKGDWCLDTNVCSNACFTDADCVSGWHCTPQPDTPPTGSSGGYFVLACAP